MNAHDAVRLHRQVLRQIFDEEYFPYLAQQLMEADRYANIAETKDTCAICSFWSTFWFLLQDHQYEKNSLYFLICDLAEGSYLIR
jgi:hypothetical protein